MDHDKRNTCAPLEYKNVSPLRRCNITIYIN